MAPEKPPPLPVSSNRLALLNQLALTSSSKLSLFKTRPPPPPPPTKQTQQKSTTTTNPKTTVHHHQTESDQDALFREASRPANQGVGYTPDPVKQIADQRGKDTRFLKDKILGKNGSRSGGGGGGLRYKQDDDDDDDDDDPGRSSLGKRKRGPRKVMSVEVEDVQEGSPATGEVIEVDTAKLENDGLVEESGQTVTDGVTVTATTTSAESSTSSPSVSTLANNNNDKDKKKKKRRKNKANRGDKQE